VNAGRLPLFCDAADDITAFAAFRVSHWKKSWSTNPLVIGAGIGLYPVMAECLQIWVY
jgi:hypothetical protein